jgi:cytoskeletal protein CcmA (bactofilin family)
MLMSSTAAAGGPNTGKLTIKGELSAQEDLALDGLFEGSIDLQGHHLTLGSHARVNAAISARLVTVEGTLSGHINGDLVEILPTADVEASVLALKLALEDGARFIGAVNTARARAAGDIARHRGGPAETQRTTR